MNPIITEMQRDKTWKAYIQGNPAIYELGETESVAVSKLLLRLQGVRMSSISGAFVFSFVMLASFLLLSWLLITGTVEMTIFNGMMWGLFLLMGIFGGAYATRQ